MPLLPGAVISDDEGDQEEPMTPAKEKIVLTSIEVGKYCLLSLAILINNLFEVLCDNFYDRVLTGP